MLRTYFLSFLILLGSLLGSLNVHASIWDTIGGCITDPCNCDQDDRKETWNKGKPKIFKAGELCPPWNKSDGRDTDNCLLQFDYPGTFIGFYLNRCAEETADSNYFSPKIRIRIQSCNAAACWSQSSTLNWDGECVVWPTGYGLPLTRVCARVALPKTPPPPGINADTTPADPGYTPGKHLNKVGFTEQDDLIQGVDGQIISTEAPKLCAYSDPGLVNLVSDSGGHVDAMDWNPNSQPLHYTTESSPIAKVLYFLVDNMTGTNLPNMIAQLLDMMGSEDSQILKLFQTIFSAIGDIANFFPELLKIAIKTFGALNSAVDEDFHFGCVQLPLGPYPPPFCSELNKLSVNAVINNICAYKNSDGTFNQSSTVPPCVVSNVRNNIINNTIRVSFNNLVPLCTDKSPDLSTCVQLKNFGAFLTAKAAHTATAYKDLLKICTPTTSTTPCIETDIKPQPHCNVKTNGCDQGFRIVYSQKMGDIETPSDYFISDIPDCDTTDANSSAVCQKIWGVNIGEFVDVSLKFPRVQGQDNGSLLPLKQEFTLQDNNHVSRTMYASIVNVPTKTNDNISAQDPTNICLFESATLIGCIERVNTLYNLATYECSSRYAGLNCSNNTYYKPQFIASMQVRDANDKIVDETSSIVIPLSYTADPTSTSTETVIKLAGYDYSSSMVFIPETSSTDPADKYIAMPFSGENSLNQFTIHGAYKNDVPPYDKEGKVNPDAVYLKYLEYLNGKYIQGGTHACLMPKNFQHCSSLPQSPENISKKIGGNVGESISGQTNCVLAKLTASDTVDCKKFKDDYRYLGLCHQEDLANCTKGDTITGATGKGITIYSCGTPPKKTNCYTNNDNPKTPVCVLSRDYQDRIEPVAELGPTLPDSKYYEVKYNSDGEPLYNMKISDIRDKTWRELSLCTSITAPTCPAISNPTNSSGNAIWPETAIGDLATGRCPINWVLIDPDKPLERYCLSDFDNKTIAFEPLAKNVGCRESKGLPIEITYNDFPESTIVPNTPYDPTTKTGDFILNKLPVKTTWGSMAFDSNDSIIDASNEPNETKLYTITFKLTLDTIMQDIDYFQILDLWYDDCVLVKINDQIVLSAPISSITSLNNLDSCNNGHDQGKALQGNVPIDLKPYLRQGDNTITFFLRVIGGGGLYYHMQYKMLR